MKINVQLNLDVPDDADLEQVQADACAPFREAEGVTVFGHSAGRLDEEYRVLGTIKGKPSERVDLVVLAQSEEEAEAKATEAEPKLAPAAVLPVGVSGAPMLAATHSPPSSADIVEGLAAALAPELGKLLG